MFYKSPVKPRMSKSSAKQPKTKATAKHSSTVKKTTPKGAITGVDVAAYVASTWSQGRGPLPLHEGCFLHARRCVEANDLAGATAFIAITPKDFWVDLVAAPSIKAGQAMLKPTKAHPELFIRPSADRAEMVPDLRRQAAEAMVKEIAQAAKAGGDGRVEGAMQFLLGFDVKLATKVISTTKSLSSPSILVPFIVLMLQAGNLAAAKDAATRLDSFDALLACELSQEHWSALAPSLRKAGQAVLDTKDVQEILDYIAKYARNGAASLLSKEPSVELARMQWQAGHLDVARKTLQRVEDSWLEERYLMGLLSAVKLIEETGRAGKSNASAWRTLSRIRTSANAKDLVAIDKARVAAAKRGPVTSYDKGVWPDVQIGEAALAVELSDEAGLATAATNLNRVLKSLAPDNRRSNLHRVVKTLLSRGSTEAAVQAASVASNKPIVMNEQEREQAILGFLPHDPPGALKALAKLAPPKLTYATRSHGRCQYLRNDWALRILEAIAPRA